MEQGRVNDAARVGQSTDLVAALLFLSLSAAFLVPFSDQAWTQILRDFGPFVLVRLNIITASCSLQISPFI